MWKSMVSVAVMLASACTCLAQVPGEWKPYSDIVGRFTVLMPGDPGEPIGDYPRGEGEAYSMRVYRVHTNNDLIYGVGYLDYQEVPAEKAAREALLDDFVSSTLRWSGAKSEGAGRIETPLPNSYPGREMKYVGNRLRIDQDHQIVPRSVHDTSPKPTHAELAAGAKEPWNMVIRIYLVNHRLFMLFFMAPTGSSDQASMQKFFNSFRLNAPVMIP